MATYRQSRNLDATLVDKIDALMTAGGWTGVTVQKMFKNITGTTLPVIVVRTEATTHERIEIGGHTMWRKPIVIIDIFASSDGQREDFKDYLITNLKTGFKFYNYVTVTSGRNTTVNSKTENGRVTVMTIEDTPLDFDTDKNTLDVIDRFRHRISLGCSLSKLEA